jgi:hypothetical protein
VVVVTRVEAMGVVVVVNSDALLATPVASADGLGALGVESALDGPNKAMASIKSGIVIAMRRGPNTIPPGRALGV